MAQGLWSQGLRIHGGLTLNPKPPRTWRELDQEAGGMAPGLCSQGVGIRGACWCAGPAGGGASPGSRRRAKTLSLYASREDGGACVSDASGLGFSKGLEP